MGRSIVVMDREPKTAQLAPGYVPAEADGRPLDATKFLSKALGSQAFPMSVVARHLHESLTADKEASVATSASRAR